MRLERIRTNITEQEIERLRWFLMLIFVVVYAAVGHAVLLEESNRNSEQIALERERITLQEASEYLESSPFHFYQTEFFEVFHNFETVYRANPPILFEESMFPFWIQRISTAFERRGVLAVPAGSIEVISRRFVAFPVQGFACTGSEQTLMIDNQIKDLAKMLGLLAHEVAHLQAEHCGQLPTKFAVFPEFHHALGSRLFLETQAQLLALDVLAEVALTDPDSTVRFIAQKAFIERLGNVLFHTEAFLTQVNNLPMNSSELEYDPDVTDSYFYGYLTFSHLLGHEKASHSLALLDQGDSEVLVRDFELEFAPELMRELGIFTG